MASEFIVVLDRSGSMESAKEDHEGGLNAFVDDQKSGAGNANFTLIQFDSSNPFEVVYDGVNMQDVGRITLRPRGGTPLVECVTRSIVHLQERLKGQKPEQVVVMVVTDGQENMSATEYTNENLRKKIADCEKEGWVFMYLGANVDEFAEARQYGFNTGTSAGFDNKAENVKYMYSNVSAKASGARCAIQKGLEMDQSFELGALEVYSFNDEERKELKDGSVSDSSSSQSD